MDSLGAGVGEFRAENHSEDIASILTAARRNLNEGNPVAALHAVVAALRSMGGEEAVTLALRRAREVYENGTRTNEATDEITVLFAQCAISTLPLSIPDVSEPMSVETGLQGGTTDNSHNGVRTSILAETGREQVVYDASVDGSSFLCQQCGGVVSNGRRDEHFAYWCSVALRN